ncbi:hypothetical protein [Haloparvum sedimenti]|uniref:hypothetical protein n=1 Tax=Haloparvum sedimenti TaxID=1678448 RepID=UPI00071E8EB2|nr:hypothetical protein [Haloparvum sedimenti]
MTPSIDRSDAGTRDTAASTDDAGTDGGEASLVGVRGRAFSLRALGVALLTLGSGSVLGGFVPIIGGSIGRLAGVAAGAFLIGALASRRRYVETALAGAGIGAASALLSALSVGFLPVGVQFLQEYGVGLVGVGTALGAVVALLGTYFGRDLRAGLTANVE